MLFRQYFIILLLVLSVSPNALADHDSDDEDEDELKILGIDAEDLGNISLYLMVGTLMLILWKPTFIWLRKYGPKRLGQEPRDFKRKLGVFNRRFMKVHTWLGFGTATIGTIHGFLLEWHWTLWLGMVCVWILVFSGSMMQWKWPTKEFRKGARLLHLQRTFSIIAIILLILGHNILD